ncbi:MAG: hypothetical protein H6940_00015 [Burkholderiales bacterium]|nr:hypothetical protein [Burkholderiales bacterium]
MALLRRNINDAPHISAHPTGLRFPDEYRVGCADEGGASLDVLQRQRINQLRNNMTGNTLLP